MQTEKKLPVNGGRIEKNHTLPHIEKKPVLLRIALIAAAAALIAVGVLRGDNDSIFRKAVFICMECIGIG